jgi:multidrug resistance efflux pump
MSATSRIAARILKVNVREGYVVKQGDVLVELDCAEGEATLGQLNAQLAAEQSTHRAAQSNANSASKNASGASQNVTAARSQVDVLKAQEDLARVDLARTQELVNRGAQRSTRSSRSRSHATGSACRGCLPRRCAALRPRGVQDSGGSGAARA